MVLSLCYYINYFSTIRNVSKTVINILFFLSSRFKSPQILWLSFVQIHTERIERKKLFKTRSLSILIRILNVVKFLWKTTHVSNNRKFLWLCKLPRRTTHGAPLVIIVISRSKFPIQPAFWQWRCHGDVRTIFSSHNGRRNIIVLLSAGIIVHNTSPFRVAGHKRHNQRLICGRDDDKAK